MFVMALPVLQVQISGPACTCRDADSGLDACGHAAVQQGASALQWSLDGSQAVGITHGAEMAVFVI